MSGAHRPAAAVIDRHVATVNADPVRLMRLAAVSTQRLAGKPVL